MLKSRPAVNKMEFDGVLIAPSVSHGRKWSIT